MISKKNYKKEKIIVVCIFLFLAVVMSYLQSVRWYMGHGDAAFLCQLVENIAARGVPYTQINADINTAVPLFSMTAEEVCSMPLPAPERSEINQMKRHAYLILYPIAPFTRLVPAKTLLTVLTATGFVVLLFLTYILLRKYDVPVLGAFLFVLLVSVHPVWSQGVFGQIYADRFFIPLCAMFLFSLTDFKSEKTRIFWAVIFGLLSVSAIERAGFIVGAFAISYAVLYRKEPKAVRSAMFLLGVFSLAYAIFAVKYIIVDSGDTQGFLSNILNFEYLKSDPFISGIKVFALFNLFLGVFAMFEYKAFLPALIVMMPNVFGNIGGAEKTGWLTHYHSLYFPILVWAAATGFIKLSHIMSSDLKRRILYSSVFFLIILCSVTSLDRIEGGKSRFSVENIKNNAWIRAERMLYDLARNGENSEIGYWNGLCRRLQTIIPQKSVVTTGEWLMPALYKNRTVHYYPIGLDVADYAVLQAQAEPAGHITYIGAVSYLGEGERRKLDLCLNARMRKAGYDLDHPVIVGNIAVIHRIASGKSIQ